MPHTEAPAINEVQKKVLSTIFNFAAPLHDS